jgi:hypothetical protein
VANRLCREVLGKTLDELPPGTRRLLSLLEQMVSEQCKEFGTDPSEARFSRREVREWTRLSDTQVRVHLRRLLELEYVVVHRGRQGQGYVYELCFVGGEESLFGEGAAATTTASSPSTSRDQGPTSRGVRGGAAGSGPRSESAAKPAEAGALEALRGAEPKPPRGPRVNGTSYRSGIGLRKTQPSEGLPLGTA